MRVRLSPQARLDLDAIWLYVAREAGSEDSATRIIESIADKFALLGRFPFLGKALDPDRGQVRIFSAAPYLIFYRPLSS
jgi:toxin ParE1/3/4